MIKSKMKVEIWSDVTCPFCYIAKRNFEQALVQFKYKDSIDIIWRSFELAPGFETQPDKNMHQLLAELKGISLEQSITISNQMADAAQKVGLQYNFDKAIPVNSFNAHRFSHFAKQRGLQSGAEEALFKSYFTLGKNIDDVPTLALLGVEIGLDKIEVSNMLASQLYVDEVNQDIAEARQRGITSVPAFVLDGKMTLIGAQETNSFLEALNFAFKDWDSNRFSAEVVSVGNQSCEIGGSC